MTPVVALRSGVAGIGFVLALAGLCAPSTDVYAQQKPKPRATKPAAPVQPTQPAVEPVPAPAPPVARDAETARAPAREEPIAFAPATARELELGYPLGVGDVVRVTVFQQPDMMTETRVSELGTITVPLLGPVPVLGVTAQRVEDRIAQLLKARGFVRDPQVTVTVLQFKSRQVSVLGQVSRPGRYGLEEGIYRLTDVLALAGGALADGSDTVTLVRVVGGKTLKFEIDLPALFRSGDFAKNPEILAGDSIYVGRAQLVYVYGEVNRPGAFRLEKDMTLMQGLSMAGGVTLRGTEKNIQLRRRDGNGKYVTSAGVLTDLLHPDDVVFVRESLF